MTNDKPLATQISVAGAGADLHSAGHPIARLIAFLGGDFARGAAGALVLRVTGASLAILMIAVATRNMSVLEFGVVAHWFNIASFLAVVAVAGQELLIVRSWGQYTEQGRNALAMGALLFGAVTVVVGALLVAATLFGAGTYFGMPTPLLAVVCLYVVTQTIMLFTSHAGRAIAGLFSGDGLREIGFRSTIILGILGMVALRLRPDATTFFMFGTVGTALVVVLQVVVMARAMPAEPLAARAEFERREWGKRSFKMWVASLLEAASQYWDVILIGLVLSPSAAGAFFVATRVANIFLIATGAFHALSSKSIAVLYHGSRMAALRQRFRAIAATNALLIVTGLLLLALSGHWLLSIFGPAYADHFGLVLVLSVGTAINTGGGPAPALLLLTGRENAYVGILAAGALVRCILIVGFSLAFGVAGAAWASAGASVAVTIALVIACRRLLNVDPSIGVFLAQRRSSAR